MNTKFITEYCKLYTTEDHSLSSCKLNKYYFNTTHNPQDGLNGILNNITVMSDEYPRSFIRPTYEDSNTFSVQPDYENWIDKTIMIQYVYTELG